MFSKLNIINFSQHKHGNSKQESSPGPSSLRSGRNARMPIGFYRDLNSGKHDENGGIVLFWLIQLGVFSKLIFPGFFFKHSKVLSLVLRGNFDYCRGLLFKQSSKAALKN